MPIILAPDQPLPIGLRDDKPQVFDPAEAWVGHVVTNPPLDAVYWSGGHAAKDAAFDEDRLYDRPPNKLILAENGTGDFTLEFRADGDCVFIMNTWPDPTVVFASDPVKLPAPPPTAKNATVKK